jgi:hypothetical protein
MTLMGHSCLLTGLLLSLALSGCRRDSADVAHDQPSESFIVEEEKGVKSGSISIDEKAGVPQLTVDVRGE